MHSELNGVLDEVLWKRIRSGDLIAFEALYARLFKLLYRYGYKIAQDADVVEDAIHDLFLDVWRYRDNLCPTTSVRYYLFSSLKRRIIRNSKNDIKSSVFDFVEDQDMLRKVLSQEEIIIESETTDERVTRLKRHLQHLPPRQYEALMMRFFNDLSYPEMGRILKVNEQSARNLVKRGIELLKKYSQITVSCIAFSKIIDFL